VAHLALSVGEIALIFEKAAEAVANTRVMLLTYMEGHHEFREVGSRMLNAWETGLILYGTTLPIKKGETTRRIILKTAVQ